MFGDAVFVVAGPGCGEDAVGLGNLCRATTDYLIILNGLISLPIENHPSFDRPAVATKLWRYMDLARFVEFLSSGNLWLTNAELLAQDDPFEGSPGALQFPHRMWTSINEVPESLRRQILGMCGTGTDGSAEAAFNSWFMAEEQRSIMMKSGRRDYYVNCWHAAEHESVAMWKIYAAPGAGVAVISNGGRLDASLAANEEQIYLGAVRYEDPLWVQIGTPNAFDRIMVKREYYAFEQEVRLVHWRTGEFHDALANFSWNEETLRFNDLIDDERPIRPGIQLSCDIDVGVEKVIVSPFAPTWYAPMIDRLRGQLGYKFVVQNSRLLEEAPVLP